MTGKSNLSQSEVQPEVGQPISHIICSTQEELKKLQCRKALDPRYICNLCGRKYSSQSILKVHKIRHRKKEDLPFHCMFCSYKSATKRDLLRHHNQHIGHARQVYKCDLCSKIFKISSSLSEHVKSVHTKETTYQCGKCDFTTERRSTFRIHLNTHSEAKVKIICPICGSCFQNKSNLKNHLMMHADAKPFACNQCSQRFTLSSRLIAHQQAVHGPKTFTCEICEKRFPSIHRLKRHSVIHTGARPFKCCFCPHTSNTQGNLLKHVRKVHAMFHFTYKDVLTENGQKVDPKKNLNPDEVRKLIEDGRECSELHLKILRAKGLTSASLEDLQDLNFKKVTQATSVLKMREKLGKPKKKSRDASLSGGKKRHKAEKKTKGKKESQSVGFEISNCDDYILPRMGDGSYIIQSNGGIDGSDVLPTTPAAIHVIWNVGVDNSTNKNPVSSNRKKGKAAKTPTKGPDKKSTKNKSINACSDINDHVNLSHASNNLNSPSTILEGGDHLSFNDKPPMLNQLHENTDFHPTNAVLVAPLDNLHHVDPLVDFEGIESPNTVVVATDGIHDFDRMCKNLDLYNQLLPINDDDAHFMNAIDSTTYREAGKSSHSKTESRDLKEKDVSIREKTTASHLSVLEQMCASSSSSRQPPQLRNKLSSRALTQHNRNVNTLILHTSQQVENCRIDSACHLAKDNNTSSVMPDEKEFVKKVIINCRPNDSSKCPIKMSCKSHTRLLSNHLKALDPLQPEEVIILHDNNDKISKKLLPKSEIRKDISRQPVREITIKNALSSYRLINDQMDVVSIAEIEESDRDVVLVIGSPDY